MDDNKLALFLALLSDEEKASIKQLLDSAEPEKLVVPKTTKGKGKGKKPVAKPVIEEEEIIDEKPRRISKNKPNKGKPHSSFDNIPKGMGAKAATTNIKLGKRPNIFLTSAEFNASKQDAEIDRLLWGKKKPSERDRDTRVESTCKICGVNEEVSALLVGRDEDTKQLQHTCKGCSANRKA